MLTGAVAVMCSAGRAGNAQSDRRRSSSARSNRLEALADQFVDVAGLRDLPSQVASGRLCGPPRGPRTASTMPARTAVISSGRGITRVALRSGSITKSGIQKSHADGLAPEVAICRDKIAPLASLHPVDKAGPAGGSRKECGWLRMASPGALRRTWRESSLTSSWTGTPKWWTSGVGR